MHNDPNTTKGSIIIVCAGASAIEALEFFDPEDVICLCDNSQHKWNTHLHGKPIYPVDSIKDITDSICHPFDIIIALPPGDGLTAVAQQLLRLGYHTRSVWQDIKAKWPSGDAFIDRDRYRYPCESASLTESQLDKVRRAVVQSMIIPRSDEYEARWLKLRSDHKHIVVRRIRVEAIGELLPRYFAMEADSTDQETLYVTLPAITADGIHRISNSYLLKYLGVVEIHESIFWIYVINNHCDEIDLSEFDKYIYRQNIPTYPQKANSIKPNFTDEEIAYGEAQMAKMGITSPFVCLSARNSQYNNKTVPSFTESIFDHRNFDFSDFEKTIHHLGSHGIMCVKMGRGENPIPVPPNCVDYSGSYYSEFMDLFLYSRCEFAISAPSGIACLAMLFSKPILYVNAFPFTYGSGGMRYTEHDIFLPKKHYSLRGSRCMSFKEIFDMEKQVGLFAENYTSQDIVLYNNTPDEILDAAIEMHDRLQGTWLDSPQDIDSLSRYTDLINAASAYQHSNHKNWIGGAILRKPSAAYSRANPYLFA